MIREYIAQLVEYEKKFLIMAPLNAVKYKEVFPLIKNNKIWLGYKPTGQDTLFHVPKDYADFLVANKKIGSGYKILNGEVMGRANVIWLTNLDIEKRHDKLDLRGNYYKSSEYPKYDNLDAIDVSKVADIPCDYEGWIGVPISFLDNYNPEQFELIGMGTGDTAKEIGVTKNYRGRTDLAITVNGKSKCPYTRIVIKNRHPEKRRYPDED
ncbi:adenine-specific methyltransferase EcoRI family protein [Catenibacterium mitsuokai]|uniref:adenine-specific methyltransferase EcoRI family protein n=1 Tax=Catenibacterium mitsuokai TaxID=100886 RepID=UPI003F8C09F1